MENIFRKLKFFQNKNIIRTSGGDFCPAPEDRQLCRRMNVNANGLRLAPSPMRSHNFLLIFAGFFCNLLHRIGEGVKIPLHSVFQKRCRPAFGWAELHLRRGKPSFKRGFSLGFTLVETILVVSIFAILGIGTAVLQKNVFLLHKTVEDSLKVYNESDKIIQPIANEIRSAQYSAAGAYCIENASSGVLIFYSDMDNDGFAERIRYFTENNIFKKAVIKPSGPPFSYNPANEIVQNLIYNVANANQLFSYYDRNYDGAGSPLAAPIDINQIRMIQITISIDENPNQLPAAVNLMTRAFVRNLKDNR